jgi:hypothetical protein
MTRQEDARQAADATPGEACDEIRASSQRSIAQTSAENMWCSMRSKSEAGTWVFSPLFIAAVGFGVTLRVLEIYLSMTTTVPGLVTMWRGATIGELGIADLACVVACIFVIVAILEALQSPKRIGGWMALGFCILLVVYAAGIYQFTKNMVDLGFPVESLNSFSEKEFEY